MYDGFKTARIINMESTTTYIITSFVYLKSLSSRMVLLRIKKPSSFSYLPGQFISIKIPHEDGFLTRFYSLSSHPIEEFLECTITINPKSRALLYFSSLRSGDSITISGPYGKYFYVDNEKPKIYLVTGSGIGPNYSILKEWINTGAKQETMLFFGIKDHTNLAYEDVFRSWEKLYPTFRFFPCLSRDADFTDEKTFFNGRVLDVFNRTIGEKQASLYDFYICGTPEMVKNTVSYLKGTDVDLKNIHFELFTDTNQFTKHIKD